MSRKTKLRKNSISRSEVIPGYLFLLPNILGFFLFMFIPVMSSIVLAFAKWDGFNLPSFTGFNNILKLFRSSSFTISFFNTLKYSLGTVVLWVAVGFLLASLVNLKIRGLTMYRTFLYFPVITSWIAVSLVWLALLHPAWGPVNIFLTTLGISSPPQWLGSSKWALFTLILINSWKGVGVSMILYLAGLQSIPVNLYESATIDGANAFQKFIKVTIPMLTPTTVFVVITGIIGSLKSFDQVFIMTEGGPGRSTRVLALEIYEQAFVYYRFGYASAIALVLFIIILSVSLTIYRTGSRSWSHE